MENIINLKVNWVTDMFASVYCPNCNKEIIISTSLLFTTHCCGKSYLLHKDEKDKTRYYITEE